MTVIGHDEEGFPVLSIFDPERCRCLLGTCTRSATVDGLCDRCFMEYAAMRNAYLTSEEWG